MNEQKELEAIVRSMVEKVKKGEPKEDILEDEMIKSSFNKFKAYVNSPNYKRVLYNNYDTWKYHVHNLNYGKVIYNDKVYDADDFYERGELVYELRQDNIIQRDSKPGLYKICDDNVINELLEQFRYVKERNRNLNGKAIILNIKKTSLIKQKV